MAYFRVYFKGVLSSGSKMGQPGTIKAVTEAESEAVLNALLPGYINEIHIEEILNPGYTIEKVELTKDQVCKEFPEMANSL